MNHQRLGHRSLGKRFHAPWLSPPQLIFIALRAGALAFALVTMTSCGSKSTPSSQPDVPEPPQAEATPTDPSLQEAQQEQASSGLMDASEVIASARQSLSAGAVDEAAARLAALQMQGSSFSSAQARDYRTALSQAYDQAIDASRRGDPRGEAAIRLLRAAAPH